MKRWYRCLAALLAAGLLASCAGPDGPAHYADQQPKLNIEEYFNGTLDLQGMVQNRAGTVTKRFTVLLTASWRDGVGTLDEQFRYTDGSTQHRVWTLRRNAPGSYTGTAPDVRGVARIEVAGNAMRLQYVLQVPVDGETYAIDFDDWLYLIDRQVMLNRATMSKFGFGVGSITVAFRKREASP